MDRTTETQLMRLVHGELPADEARELEERIGREPELAAAAARWRDAWEGLAAPEPAPAPPGFAARVLARACEEAAPQAAGNPWLARLASATALAAGVALGFLAASPPPEPAAYLTAAPTLADGYWQAIEEPEGRDEEVNR